MMSHLHIYLYIHAYTQRPLTFQCLSKFYTYFCARSICQCKYNITALCILTEFTTITPVITAAVLLVISVYVLDLNALLSYFCCAPIRNPSLTVLWASLFSELLRRRCTHRHTLLWVSIRVQQRSSICLYTEIFDFQLRNVDNPSETKHISAIKHFYPLISIT